MCDFKTGQKVIIHLDHKRPPPVGEARRLGKTRRFIELRGEITKITIYNGQQMFYVRHRASWGGTTGGWFSVDQIEVVK